MIGHYITVNGVQYPNSKKPKFTPKNYEKITQSEAYTDLTSVGRLNKFDVSFTFQVTGKWKDRILNDCNKPVVNAVILNKPYRGRLRIKSYDLVEGSEFMTGVNGLWIVNVTFTEN